MFPKRLLLWCGARFSLRQVPRILGCKLKHAPHLLILVAALAAMGGNVARAQWVQTNGPYGGRIGGLAVIGHKLFSGIYEGPYSGSVLGTTDSGKHWNPVHKFLPDTGIYIEAIDGNLYGEVWSGSHPLPELFQSSDSGKSWTNIMDEFPFERGVDLPEKFGSWLLIDGDSLRYRSTDHGLTWTVWESDFMPSFLIDADYVAVTTAGVFRSTDSGRTWLKFGDDSLPPNWRATSLGKDLIVATDFGVYRSTDEGANWNHVDSTNWSPYVQDFGTLGPVLFVGTGNTVYRSYDTGKTWLAADSGLNDYSWCSAFAVMGSILFSAGQYGVFQSTDSGRTWSPTALQGDGSSAGILTMIDSNIFVNGGDILFRSADNGESWNLMRTEVNLGEMISNGLNLFALDGYNHVYESTDLGADWDVTRSKGLSQGSCNNVELEAIGGTLIATTECNGVFFSTDNAETWTARDSGLARVKSNTDTNYYYVRIQAIVSNGNSLFAWADGGSIYRSTNNGESWSLTQNIGLPDSNLGGPIAICKGSLFAGIYEHGIYRSSDNGNSWIAVNNGIAPTISDGFIVIGTNIFAEMQDSGVYLSTDNGESWAYTGIGNQFGSGTFAIADGYLFLSTEFGGVWRRPLSDFGISAVSEPPQPSAVTIRAYPNPVSESTTIDFTAETAGYASVVIVNVLGTEVARLFSGELAAGAHSFTWDAAKSMSDHAAAPRGFYECVVRMNGRVEQAGIVVMR